MLLLTRRKERFLTSDTAVCSARNSPDLQARPRVTLRKEPCFAYLLLGLNVLFETKVVEKCIQEQLLGRSSGRNGGDVNTSAA